MSFITGWTWLIGNWTITLSVNFAFASLVAACISMFQPEFVVTAWQLLLIVYAITLLTFFVVAFGNRLLPLADTFAAGFTLIAIIVTLVCLSVKADAGRNSPADALGHYDTSLSGWGSFSFFIGILPAAYTFSAVGMVSAMAEECDNPTIKLPKAMALCVPVGGIAGLFYIIPICATMPSLETIIAAPVGQALPYIFQIVMGSPAGGLGLTLLVLIITFFCSVSITTIGSRCTWAFARDNAIPGSRLFRRLHGETPVAALALSTIVQMLLGLINLGSSSAFLAFVSVGLMALAISYAIPISISMWHCRREVNRARWTMGPTVGWPVNAITVIWIAFEMVLFSMPTVLPVTEVSMNYAIVVFVGFMVLSGLWYLVYAHKGECVDDVSDVLGVANSSQCTRVLLSRMGFLWTRTCKLSRMDQRREVMVDWKQAFASTIHVAICAVYRKRMMNQNTDV